MAKNFATRSWVLTIPFESCSLRELEDKLKKYTYVGQLEQGEKTGYVHWQIYIENRTPIAFSTLSKRFPKGHFEARRTTKEACYNYVTKEATRFPGFDIISNGDINAFGSIDNKKNVSDLFVEAILSGYSDYELLEEFPSQFLLYSESIPKIRFTKLEKDFQLAREDLKVLFLSGESRVGKTTWVLDTFGEENVCRITNYDDAGMFDSYTGQDVLFLDEFTGEGRLNIGHLNSILERRGKFFLSARYYNRPALYSKVIVSTNLHFEDLYAKERAKANFSEVFTAFRNRFTEGLYYMTFQNRDDVIAELNEKFGFVSNKKIYTIN